MPAEIKPKQKMPTKVFREGIQAVEDKLSGMEGAKFGDAACPLKHSFGEGLYVREIFNPKGMLLVTKIHKLAHPYFLLKGEMSILTEQGVKRIKAPYYGITPAGTKRVIYVHEDVVFVTVHANPDNGRDLKKIEERIIAKNFDELPSPEEIKQLKEA